MNKIKQNLDLFLKKHPSLQSIRKDIEESFAIMKESYQNDGKLMVCGNGGSAADSEHIVGELMKGFKKKRPVPDEKRKKLINNYPENGEYLADNLQQVLPAISLVSQSALFSAFVNDKAPDMIFAQQVFGYGNKGDVLLGISTSGNSENVINAVKVAKTMAIKTIGLTGNTGGRLKNICDCCIIVPEKQTADIQEKHLPIYHFLCAVLEEEFFD